MRFYSIEWSASVARLLTHLSDIPKKETRLRLMNAHYVLPCRTPLTNPDADADTTNQSQNDKLLQAQLLLQQQFHDLIPRSQQIRIVVACQHDSFAALEHTLQDCEPEDRILVVGGHDKDDGNNHSRGLTSVQVIQMITSSQHPNISRNVWAVANPNQPDDRIDAKLAAGATGFVTQPLLSSRAADHVERYYPITNDVSYVMGLALPQTLANLEFWWKLVDAGPACRNDIAMKEHRAWFQAQRDSRLWIRRQRQLVESLDDQGSNSERRRVLGLHAMPMRNTDDLLAILEDEVEEEDVEDGSENEYRQ